MQKPYQSELLVYDHDGLDVWLDGVTGVKYAIAIDTCLYVDLEEVVHIESENNGYYRIDGAETQELEVCELSQDLQFGLVLKYGLTEDDLDVIIAYPVE